MFIKNLRVLNFACHADTKLDDLSDVTALIGPNGGGKSALFEAIRTFTRVLSRPISEAYEQPPFSFDDKLFRGAHKKKEMGFEASLIVHEFPEIPVTYSIRLGYEDTDNRVWGDPPTISDETVKLGGQIVFDRRNRQVEILEVESLVRDDITTDRSLLRTILEADLERKFRGQPELRALAKKAGSAVQYRLEPRALSTAAPYPSPDSDHWHVRMGYNGENLPATLKWLQENKKRPDIFPKILEDIQEVIGKCDITFNSTPVDRIGFKIEYQDARRNILAPNTSSGTRLLLGLITILNWPELPDIVCIEEPETGLTPKAVEQFCKLLRDAQDDSSTNTQFFFSSHSPFVLHGAWNTATKAGADRSFIRRLRVSGGQTVVEPLVAADNVEDIKKWGAAPQTDGTIGLQTACNLLCGSFIPEDVK